MMPEMIEVWMNKIFGRNWRTSLAGIITAVAGFIAANPQHVKNELVVSIAQFITAGGFISMAVNTKDRQVSGIPVEHRADDTFAEEEKN